MMRKLLVTTALATMLSAPALAQNKPANQAGEMNQTGQTNQTSQANQTDRAGQTDADARMYILEVYTLSDANVSGYLASNMLGKTVYTSTAEDAEAVGEINDIVLGDDGSVKAVIVGVGGLLGIGEKEVAVDFERLSIKKVDGGQNEVRAVTDVSKEELESAQAYERPDYIADWRGDLDQDDTAQAPAAGTTAQDTTGRPAEATDPRAARQQFLEGKTKVQAASISADQLMGATVYGANWESIGDIGDIVLTNDGQIDAAVVDVGGFLGLGAKPVAVGFDQVEIYADEAGEYYVATPYTEEQLEQAQAYEEDGYGQNRDAMRLSE